MKTKPSKIAVRVLQVGTIAMACYTGDNLYKAVMRGADLSQNRDIEIPAINDKIQIIEDRVNTNVKSLLREADNSNADNTKKALDGDINKIDALKSQRSDLQTKVEQDKKESERYVLRFIYSLFGSGFMASGVVLLNFPIYKKRQKEDPVIMHH